MLQFFQFQIGTGLNLNLGCKTTNCQKTKPAYSATAKSSMFKLIFQSAPIGLIFGQIAYRNNTREWIFIFVHFGIIIVITILPKTGQNTENTTFLHVKMKAYRACPADKSYQNRFLWTRWF